MGDSLAAHQAVSSFFDMRAAWTKWVDDMLYTQSMLEPAGTMSTIVPCIFQPCRNDPRHPGRTAPDIFADVAWGSALPLLAAYTAELTGDGRFASRAAVGAGAYVELLHSHANAPTSNFPGLLNWTNWSGHLGDWVPVLGKSAVSTLLNSHHLILDIDAALALLQGAKQDGAVGRVALSEADLVRLARTARESFRAAFLRNVTVQSPGMASCGSVRERQPLELSCSAGQTISQVIFAGYGLPNGTCATGLQPNAQCFLDVRSPVSAMCVGQSQCVVECDLSPGKRLCAGVSVHDPCGGVAKDLSVSVRCSTEPGAPAPGPLVGLAFQDLHGRISHGPAVPGAGVQPQTEAASGMAAMDLAPASLIDEAQREDLGNMLVALVVNHSAASTQKATITGGIYSAKDFS